MDSDSSTTQSESEIRVENLNEDHRDSIDADDEETYEDEGNPMKHLDCVDPTQQFNFYDSIIMA